MIALASKGRYEEIADLQFPLLVHPARRDDADLRAAVRGMARDTGAAAFIRQENAIIGRIDSRPTLGEIRCPTLVLVGEQDGITPLDRAEEIVAGVSGASLVKVPECGHLSAMERPQAVTAALAAFLAA